MLWKRIIEKENADEKGSYGRAAGQREKFHIEGT